MSEDSKLQQKLVKIATQASGNTKPEAVAKDWKCPKKRAFLLTFNENAVENCNICVKQFKKLKSCDYLICCKEFNKAGNEHCHMYVHFENAYPIPEKLIKKTKMHVDVAMGSPKQNIEYVRKEGPKWQKKKSYQKTEIIAEYGSEPRQGSMSISELREIKNSDDLPDWKQYNVWKQIQKEPKSIRVGHWRKKVEVYWIQGPSGCGKSTRAEQIVEEKGYEYFDVVKHDDKGFWLSVKDTTKAAIYDEFRDFHLPACEFISFIDYNLHDLRTFGGSIQNNYELIIITTIQPIDTIYLNANNIEEDRNQWTRRIKVIDMYQN